MPLIKWITVRLDVSETNGAVANKGMEPQGRRRTSPFRVTKRSTKLRRLSKTTRSRVHVQTVGLNAETKKVSAPSRRREMSLDIPFYRTFLLRRESICFQGRSPPSKLNPRMDCTVRRHLEMAHSEPRERLFSLLYLRNAFGHRQKDPRVEVFGIL